MPLSPILRAQATYPFVRLDEARRAAEARGGEVIDFGRGDPQEPTDPRIRQALVDGLRERMGYPVQERGAAIAGARVVTLPLLEGNAFLPDIGAVGEDVWSRTALFWVNYPNNPTCATAPLAFYERLAALAREHDVVLASDEAYSELWFEEPPASVLQVADLTNVAAFNSLSKRSSMTGYRSGFVAGDPTLIGALKAFRPSVGTAPQEFVWCEVPGGEGSEAFARRLLERGVLVAPGAYLGPSGEGYFRLALVPTEAKCVRAAEILEDVL